MRDRILVHLANFSRHMKDHQVPFEVTQRGIAEAVGIRDRHLVQNIRPMIVEGLVMERSSYAIGGRQHRKVYFLTTKGEAEANWLGESVYRTRRNSKLNRQKARPRTELRPSMDPQCL